jgi:hypothetical protein
VSVKRIIIVFLFLLIVIAAVLIVIKRKKATPSLINLPSPTPSVTEQIEKQFPGLNIPSNAEQIELKNVSGGEAMGIAIRGEVIANLPTLSPGQSYQVYLGNGTKTVLLGSMVRAKGGWILEYNSSKYPGYNQIFVKKDSETILEGSF